MHSASSDKIDALEAEGRAAVAAASRIVVKVGSSSLTTPEGRIDANRIRDLVDVLAVRRTAGQEVILVSSGAVAAGMTPLGMTHRPHDLASQQAAASVGQGLLLAAYTAELARYGLNAAQVLLTVEDMMRRVQHRNSQRTLRRLLDIGALPIVNENDTVATHEIRFGDNDRLAALVAHLMRADALVLLSDVDALYDGKPSDPGTSVVDLVRDPTDLAGIDIGSTGKRGVGTGGMVTKVDSARIASQAGVHTVLTSAANAGAVLSGSGSVPSSLPPADGAPRHASSGSRTPPPGAAVSCSTRARCGPWCRRRLPCFRPGSSRPGASSAPATRSTCVMRKAPWWRADWSTTTPSRCPTSWAVPRAGWRGRWGPPTSASSCTATTWCCSGTEPFTDGAAASYR